MRHSYYVVMVDYGRNGREAIVDPEVTRREVVSRVKSGEYRNIHFIHHILMDDEGGSAVDVTNAILRDAGVYDPVYPQAAE